MTNAIVAVELLIRLLAQASAVSELIKKSRAENRDITDEEMDALADADDAARMRLEDAIAAAKGTQPTP
jgi:hypothetical protein